MNLFLSGIFIFIAYFSLAWKPLESNLDTDSAKMFSRKFNFSNVSQRTNIETKIDFFETHILEKDTNSIFFFTNLDSYSDYLKLSKNVDDVFDIIDTAELNRNLHFVDLDEDGKLDCIYDRLDFNDDNLQFIYLFFNTGNQFERVNIPGFFITNWEVNGTKVQIETYRWACCDESFNHLYELELENAKLTSTTHFLLSIDLDVQDLRNHLNTYNTKEIHKLFSDCSINHPIFYLTEEYLITIGKELKVINEVEVEGVKWELVGVDIESELTNDARTKLIGWIKTKQP